MDRKQWQEIERLYHLALERPADRRKEFLAVACGADHSLLHEVESLLSQTDQPTEEFIREPDRWGPGVQVGPYKLEAAIGAGGMGEVFRAVDTRLHRTVAIKFLLDSSSDSSQRGRFLREARAASALNHPNIVTVYDISTHDGTDFLVMEYVQGQTLEQLISPEGLPCDKVTHLGAQIALALHAAHEAGIVHRDVKPANVIVTGNLHVKVLDFGIAKMLTEPGGANVTMPGLVVGTAAYMSPEQTRGEALDGRSDIFSLGCVLYKAATGRLPFEGASHWEIMHKIATAPAASLRIDLPQELRNLIAACLQKDPNQRPGSAAEVAERLRRPQPVTVRTDNRRSIAVVPFRFRGAASEDRFLSVALAEAAANRLGATGELLVRPTASVMRYAGADAEWTDVARELNVDVVVEGAIQKSGTRLRVLTQAYQASDMRTLHSSQHDGDQSDLFALQDRIADSLVGVFVKRRQTNAEPAIPPTSNPLAYELYLRAADRGVRMNKFDLASAIEMLTRAIELDPEFADAWGQLAHAYSQMGMHLDPNPQWFEKGEQAVARALELDPVQCDALCGRAQILWSPSHGFQHRPALRAMNAALRINPSRHLARHFRSAILFHLGSYEQSKRDAQESLLNNPNYVMGHVCLGMIAWYTGDYEQAKAIYEHCLALEPSLLHGNIFGPMPSIYMGRFEEARTKIRKARPMTPTEPQLLAAEGLIHAFEGDFRKAEEMSDEACSNNNLSLTHTHHIWHCAAGTYAIIGRPDKTMEQLKRCATMGLPNYRLFLGDPALASMRNHPEFIELMSDLRRGEDQYRVDLDLAARADR
jgi:TolB-like protein/Tfp pilus assembly protein PilF/predicted Ser/Thr protein kinase